MSNVYEITGIRTDGDTGHVAPFTKRVRATFKIGTTRALTLLKFARILDQQDDYSSYMPTHWRGVA